MAHCAKNSLAMEHRFRWAKFHSRKRPGTEQQRYRCSSNLLPPRVLPALREAGVSDEQVREMTQTNPRRIFEAQGPY